MIAEISIKHSKGNLDFNYKCNIEQGITGIYGPSGAGKSTFLNLLSGLEIPKDGLIKLNSEVVFDKQNNINISEAKRGIGYVFQDGRLFPHLSVKQNLCFSKPYVKNRRRVITLEEVVGILEIDHLLDKMPRQLSGGERQRVAIGRALLSQPNLLLLDEPFSNLDRYLRRQIISYLLKINSLFSIPMLIVSHVIGDILRLTNQMLIIDEGEVPASGNVFSLMVNNSVPHIIKPRRYLNIYEACLKEYSKEAGLYIFGHVEFPDVHFATSARIAEKLKNGDKIRFAIRPDDIALSTNKIENISIQNQLRGIVSDIIKTKESTFCVVDCGFDLIVELTDAAIKNLSIETGNEIFCLIKAKAIEIIHVF